MNLQILHSRHWDYPNPLFVFIKFENTVDTLNKFTEAFVKTR